ncbi:MAG: hypothetical protein Q4G59_12975 [Planctomycetia bacterium]|nr:hypothetical protein [Planctomycetia bacterium]
MQDRCVYEVVEERPEWQWEGMILRVAYAIQFYIPLGILVAILIFSLPLSGLGGAVAVFVLFGLLLFILPLWLISHCVYAASSLRTSLIVLAILNLALYLSFLFPNWPLQNVCKFFAFYDTLPAVGYLIVLFCGKREFFSRWQETH